MPRLRKPYCFPNWEIPKAFELLHSLIDLSRKHYGKYTARRHEIRVMLMQVTGYSVGEIQQKMLCKFITANSQPHERTHRFNGLGVDVVHVAPIELALISRIDVRLVSFFHGHFLNAPFLHRVQGVENIIFGIHDSTALSPGIFSIAAARVFTSKWV